MKLLKYILFFALLMILGSIGYGQNVLNQGNAATLINQVGGIGASKYVRLPQTPTGPTITATNPTRNGYIYFGYPYIHWFDTASLTWIPIISDTGTSTPSLQDVTEVGSSTDVNTALTNRAYIGDSASYAGRTFIFQGTSITNGSTGLPNPTTERWPYLVSQYFGATQDNQGTSGSTLIACTPCSSLPTNLGRIPTYTAGDIMIFEFGVNDIRFSPPTFNSAAIATWYDYILADAESKGWSMDNILIVTPVFFYGNIQGWTQPYADYLLRQDSFVNAVSSYAATKGTMFLDLWSLTEAQGMTLLNADSLHPNVAGHAFIAEKVDSVLSIKINHLNDTALWVYNKAWFSNDIIAHTEAGSNSDSLLVSDGGTIKAISPLQTILNDTLASYTKIYDPVKYGAIPDDGLSDDVPIQAAINDCYANGLDGIVKFSKSGEFDVDTVRTLVDGLNVYGHLYIPYASETDVNRGTLVIEGCTPYSMQYINPNSTLETWKQKVTIIRSRALASTITNSGIIVKQRPNTGGSVNWNRLAIRNIALIVKDTAVTTNPSMFALNLQFSENGDEIMNVAMGIDTPLVNSIYPNPAVTFSCGVFLGNISKRGVNRIENSMVWGFRNGFRFSNKTTLTGNLAVGCVHPYYLTINRYPSMMINNISEYCVYGISSLDHFGGTPTDSVHFTVQSHTFKERKNFGKWFDSQYSFWDSLNHGRGTIMYHLLDSSGIEQEQNFTKNGGEFVKCYSIQEYPLTEIDTTTGYPLLTKTQAAALYQPIGSYENPLTFTAPLVRTVNAISMPVATTLADGYLSSANWTTFNSKVGGSGTTNTVPLFTASGTIGNSVITQSSSNIGIGMTPTEELTVAGTIQVTSKAGADNILMNFTNSIGLNYARILEASTAGLGGMVFDGYRNAGSGLGVLFRGYIASSGAMAHEFRGQGGTLSTTVAYPSTDLTLFSHVTDGAGTAVNDFKISATGVTTHYNPTNANSVIETVSNTGVITRDATGASASHVFSDPVTVNGQTNTQNVEPITDDTYYLGENSSTTPHAYKGLILKDQSNGNYYRIEMVAGVLTTTLL